MIHARNPETSQKLSRILAFLRERGEKGATSRDIVEFCETVAPGTCVSELRKAGYVVTCAFERTLESGAKVFRYRLL
jgi:hypothetical protein